MSLYYLKALEGEEPYASWYGLSRNEPLEVTITIEDEPETELEKVLAESEKLLAEVERNSKRIDKLLSKG